MDEKALTIAEVRALARRAKNELPVLLQLTPALQRMDEILEGFEAAAEADARRGAARREDEQRAAAAQSERAAAEVTLRGLAKRTAAAKAECATAEQRLADVKALVGEYQALADVRAARAKEETDFAALMAEHETFRKRVLV